MVIHHLLKITLCWWRLLLRLKKLSDERIPYIEREMRIGLNECSACRLRCLHIHVELSREDANQEGNAQDETDLPKGVQRSRSCPKHLSWYFCQSHCRETPHTQSYPRSKNEFSPHDV